MARKLKSPPFHWLDAIYTPDPDFDNTLTAMEKGKWVGGGGGSKYLRPFHILNHSHDIPPPLTNNHYESSNFQYCFLFKNMNYIHQFSKQSLKSGGLVELWLISFSIYSKKKGEGGVKIPRRVKLVPFFRFQFYIH